MKAAPYQPVQEIAMIVEYFDEMLDSQVQSGKGA